jgi:uncharacterized caspase-like protein
MHRVLSVGICSALVLAAPAVVRCATPQGVEGIEILEPASWGAVGTRSIEIVPRSSLRVVGLASHASGIGKVLLDGVPASLTPQPDGRVRFSGFVKVDEQTTSVEIVAVPMVGPPLTRSFGIAPVARPPAGPAPERAWGSGSGFGGERWAVVVGVGAYDDERIPALRYADDDAQAFRDFLVSENAGLGGFEPDHVRLLINEEATVRNIRSALLTWLRGATDDDLVVIYFAGHGAPDPARLDDHYLLAWDTDLDDLPATALLMEDVSDAIRRVYHKHLVLLADACHSAGVGGQTATRSLSINAVNSAFLDRVRSTTGGQVTFTASQVNQLSQEDARWGGGHGVFTHFLLEGLKGRADEDGDRVVTLGETMEFVRDAVRRETRNAQIPTISQTSFDWYLPLAIAREDVQAEAPGRVAESGAGATGTRAGADRADRAPATVAIEGAAPAPGRAEPRVGVEVRLESDLEGVGPDALVRMLRGQVERALRDAGLVVSDLSVDSTASDVVVAVAATLSDQGEVPGGMRSAGLEVALSARERGGTVVLASADRRGNGAGLSATAAGRAALERNAPQAVAELVEGLRSAWQDQEEGSFRVRVRVAGLEGYGQVMWLTENLGRAVAGSAGIVERSADLGNGVAELEWFVALPAAEVARAIEATRFQDYDVRVTKVEAGLLELRLVAR